jgi:putative glutamine amidotransferase
MRVGLTYTGSDKKHENYARWIQDGDGSIEVVRIEAGGEGGGGGVGGGEVDALVLSGGVDIAPEFYSGDNIYAHAPNSWERARDLFELGALEWALGRKIPVFGVCRGLQLINVALGGTLVQDLGEGGDAVHEGTAGADKQHGVRVEKGSLLASVVGQDRGLVNSAHHQAIARLAEGLRVSCRAEDGTIEGVEWVQPEGRSFLLAVQWHPERMYVNGFADTAFYRALRDRFIKEINEQHGDH